MDNKILIYSDLCTARQKYIFTFIFDTILGISFEITTNLNYFNTSTQAKFQYTKDRWYSGCHILKPHPILFEDVIKEIPLDFFKYKNELAFFKSSSDSLFPFDIFAASFYLISRYEEYLPYLHDKHGRFPAGKSIASKKGFLEEPIIDNWALLFKEKLLELFPELKFNKRNFQFLSTIDIDNTYAHLHKGLFRTSLSVLQTAIKSRSQLKNKLQVLRGKIKDPYDNYEYLDKTHQFKNIKTLYFILFSKYGKYDKNLPISNKAFHKLIKDITKKNEIGMHPSYQSNNNFELLKNEKKALEKLIGKSIDTSRQHFLKLKIPDTYENLIKLDIISDHSMGYASQPGFRAGTCTPFCFFNLKNNEETNLKITPFAIMDVCFKDYLKCSPTNTLKKIKKIITSVKKVDGLFVSLWHNESLNEEIEQKEHKHHLNKNVAINNLKDSENLALTPGDEQLKWRDVYEGMLNEARSRN